MVWAQTFFSILIVSLVSLVGILTFFLKEKVLEKTLIYLVSLSVGTLLGGAFFHLIPEAFSGDGLSASFLILLGILVFFILEKIVHWRHCHEVACDEHPHPFSYMIFTGDALHNFIDGMVIAASFMVSAPLGLATTVAVILHEIPQEIGDFGSLVYAGFSKSKALAFNFVSALSAFAGAFIVLIIGENFIQMAEYLIPITAGGFIYIAMSDLIPEIHKTKSAKKSLIQLIFIFLGLAAMTAILGLE